MERTSVIAIFVIWLTICFPSVAFAAKPKDPIVLVGAITIMMLILGVIAVILNIFKPSKDSFTPNSTVDHSSQRIHTDSGCKPHDANSIKLTTRWLWFYTYVYLPVTILAGFILNFVQYNRLKEDGYEIEVSLQIILLILYLVSYFVFTCFLIYGLHKRRFWGWICNWISLGVTVILNRAFSLDSWNKYIFGVILLSLILFLPNYIYFIKRKSLFAKQFYPLGKLSNQNVRTNLLKEDHAELPQIPVREDLKPVATTKDEEKFYETVAAEIDTNKVKKGIWVKAFSLANGNESLTKATYVKLRMAQLIEEGEHQRQAKAEEEDRRLKLKDTIINLGGSDSWRTRKNG